MVKRSKSSKPSPIAPGQSPMPSEPQPGAPAPTATPRQLDSLSPLSATRFRQASSLASQMASSEAQLMLAMRARQTQSTTDLPPSLVSPPPLMPPNNK